MIQQLHSWAYIFREDYNSKRCMHPSIHSSTIAIAKKCKLSKCPSGDEWIKTRCIHTMEYYSAIKWNEIMPLEATWMQLEIMVQSEINQKEKYKYCVI